MILILILTIFALIVLLPFGVGLYMRWRTGNEWWPYKDDAAYRQALIDSGEPILHVDQNGRRYLRAKVGLNQFREWYI